MLFAGGHDKKTLTDVMRDYRAGILQKVTIPGIGTAYDNCLLVKSGSSSVSLQPGDIVPLKDFQIFGDDHRDDDSTYSHKRIFGCSDRCGIFDGLTSFSENAEAFTPIPFGIAKDFITSSQYGNVQVQGRVWALVEVIPMPSYPHPDNYKYVVVRKNSRHDGKPFLQTAADGLAEVLQFGKTLANGMTWALIQLNHPYGGKLCTVKNASSNIDRSTLVYSNTSATFYDPLPHCVYPTCTVDHIHPYYTNQDYHTVYDNYITLTTVPEIQTNNFIASDTPEYSNFFSGEKRVLEIYQNRTFITNPGFPTHVNILGHSFPFTGGIFPAQFIGQGNQAYFKIFGNEIPASQMGSHFGNWTSDPKALDLWNGDWVYVQITPATAENYFLNPSTTTFVIVSGPLDYRVGTIIPFIGTSYPNGLTSRGWEVMNWTNSFTSDIAVLKGNGALTVGNHTHDFTYFSNSNPIDSTTDTENQSTKTYDTPFNIILLKKATAGYTC